MTRMTPFSNPLLLGFDTMEKTLERVAKSGDSYPPYNIERQLVVRGKQVDDGERDFLHRGIAARQFQRIFVLADGMRVTGAALKNGLLAIDLDRPEPERLVKKINILVKD